MRRIAVRSRRVANIDRARELRMDAAVRRARMRRAAAYRSSSVRRARQRLRM